MSDERLLGFDPLDDDVLFEGEDVFRGFETFLFPFFGVFFEILGALFLFDSFFEMLDVLLLFLFQSVIFSQKLRCLFEVFPAAFFTSSEYDVFSFLRSGWEVSL